MTSDQDDLSIQIQGVAPWQAPEGQAGQGMLLKTTRGDIQAIVHHDQTTPTTRGIVWVWGARGGFDGPADSIYGDLSEKLKTGITSVRVNYRDPRSLQESVLDTLIGISFLVGTGHTDILLVGHSFGGAVVITAAPLSEKVKAVVALSSQTFGARNAGRVSPRPLLLVHGEEDTRLPSRCSEQIYEWAEQPKELVLYPDAEHGLRECKDELRALLTDWIPKQFDGLSV
ncbi:MAG: dienelactone hydrolase family protein [Chloroflexi bacterium]|nr:dienelactone hydrolase family protein [Chloroflexota bacterium]